MGFLRSASKRWPILLTCFLGIALQSVSIAEAVESKPWDHGRLVASPDGHYLVYEDGTPFFWMADTAWGLFHRVPTDIPDDPADPETYKDAVGYLKDRQAKGFNVIMTFVAADWWEPRNVYGDPPFDNSSPLLSGPLRLNANYFARIGEVVDAAARNGQYVVLNIGQVLRPDYPTWFVATPDYAYRFGWDIARKFQGKPNIIWSLGQDFDPALAPDASGATLDVRPLVRAMAEGIADGTNASPENSFSAQGRGDGRADYSTTLMTFHPKGQKTSSDWFQADTWLDFNMWQVASRANSYSSISADYSKGVSGTVQPPKPVVDGEPKYEDAVLSTGERVSAYYLRRNAYWNVFAGAMGQTYGADAVHSFVSDSDIATGGVFSDWDPPRSDWYTQMQLPGAYQMGYLRGLVESRPMMDRIPDQSVIVGDAGSGSDRLQAMRAGDGGYAYIYSANGRSFDVDLSRISGKEVQAWWYDPRTGTASSIGRYAASGAVNFVPPGVAGEGNDWVLVLDDDSRGYSAPGRYYLGAPFKVGQVMEAEFFDNGVEGSSYHDAEPANLFGNPLRAGYGVDIEQHPSNSNGYNIGAARPGEWFDYTVDVKTGGLYTLYARFASARYPGTVHVEVDGVDVTGPVTLPVTAGWHFWKTRPLAQLQLEPGRRVLTVVMDGSEGSSVVNFDSFLLDQKNSAPVASLSGSVFTAVAGHELTFDGSASFDSDGDPLIYMWDFGDGSSLENGVTRSHTFAAPGDYTVTLMVSDYRVDSLARRGTVHVRAAEENIAPLAVASCSMESLGTGQVCSKAMDGLVGGYPENHTVEWATLAGGAGAWIQLDWAGEYSIDRIVLHDRPNDIDQIASGTLIFSDGSRISVGMLPNDGSPLTVTFPQKTVSSVRLNIDGVSASTRNVGLSEIEVY
jgi:hypothetical protein